MATLTIKLPPHDSQTEFNLRRWDELLADRELAKIEGRVGRTVVNQILPVQHGMFAAEVAIFLDNCQSNGRVMIACPISTADGVRAVDVAWASSQRFQELGNRSCFPHAPEICVEVLSPGNSDAEIHEKMALYFDAGASEVWLCETSGRMKFFSSTDAPPISASKLCPDFPAHVQLEK